MKREPDQYSLAIPSPWKKNNCTFRHHMPVLFSRSSRYSFHPPPEMIHLSKIIQSQPNPPQPSTQPLLQPHNLASLPHFQLPNPKTPTSSIISHITIRTEPQSSQTTQRFYKFLFRNHDRCMGIRSPGLIMFEVRFLYDDHCGLTIPDNSVHGVLANIAFGYSDISRSGVRADPRTWMPWLSRGR